MLSSAVMKDNQLQFVEKIHRILHLLKIHRRMFVFLLLLFFFVISAYQYKFPKKMLHFRPQPPTIQLGFAEPNRLGSFVETSVNSESYLIYRSQINHTALRVEEMTLRRQIMNEIVQLKYFSMQRISNDADAYQFQTSLLERQDSLLFLCKKLGDLNKVYVDEETTDE